MAHFAVINGQNGFAYINLELVRKVTQDREGNVTFVFDSEHHVTLNAEDSKHAMAEVIKNSSEKSF